MAEPLMAARASPADAGRPEAWTSASHAQTAKQFRDIWNTAFHAIEQLSN
jgi:hypothetical protein